MGEYPSGVSTGITPFFAKIFHSDILCLLLHNGIIRIFT